MSGSKDYHELDQFSWPWCGDQLISENEDSNENVEIDSHVFTWGVYADAYRTAVDILLNYHRDIKEDYPSDDCNNLIVPIMHLIRHAIELKIKELSARLTQLFEIPDRLKEIDRKSTRLNSSH